MLRGSNSLVEDPEAAAGDLAESARTLSLTPYKQFKFTNDSDLSNPDRRIWVVTTAGMPWRTGTAVNPLMRALYLTRGRPKGSVTLMIPWLADVEARRKLYGNDNGFKEGQSEQEAWIRNFCRTRANCQVEEENMRITFWEGTYSGALGSIFPTVDICALVPNEEADVAILEEPEHLNWFRVPETDEDEATRLGWSHKFKHVVGILHTNYAAYVKLYSMGTSFLTAPALNALSSLVIRANCHKVIRLSAALPSLDPPKEVTCNVHGVRSEFLNKPKTSDVKEKHTDAPAKVYFIGKVIWAKGFDDLLEVQELFRTTTGAYFPIDIYGDGEDFKGIKRAFLGRRPGSSSMGVLGELSGKALQTGLETADATLKLVQNMFVPKRSIDEDERSKSSENWGRTQLPARSFLVVQNHYVVRYIPEQAIFLNKSNTEDFCTTSAEEIEMGKIVIIPKPFSFLHFGFREVLNSTLKLMESVVQNRFLPKRSIDQDEKSKPSKHRVIIPVWARLTWRRTPLQARFLGVQDHIVVRDIPEQTIFLNMSTTEVLCTTSAEALAMGKFVILPKHPSNEFFYQFANCLAFESLNDCVVKLQYALSNEPEPLSDKYKHMLSWEGAMERLFTSSGITEKDEAQRIKSGMSVEDEKAARFHVESASSGRFFRNLFQKVDKGPGRTLV